MITKGIKELCEEAEAEIETLSVDDARALQGNSDVTFVDIRDVRELWREGAIPGAVHAPRGMLEPDFVDAPIAALREVDK